MKYEYWTGSTTEEGCEVTLKNNSFSIICMITKDGLVDKKGRIIPEAISNEIIAEIASLPPRKWHKKWVEYLRDKLPVEKVQLWDEWWKEEN